MASTQNKAGGQQACNCDCCQKNSCSCKQASDCSCAGCQKHICRCTTEAAEEKKAADACECRLCESGSICSSEDCHQRKCDCRCCKQGTCSCCKSKKTGAGAAAAQPAFGKIHLAATPNTFTPPTSSSSVWSSHQDCGGSSPLERRGHFICSGSEKTNVCALHWHAARSCCNMAKHVKSNCSSHHTYSESSSSSHHTQYCSPSAGERQVSASNAERDCLVKMEAPNNSSSRSYVPSGSGCWRICCSLPSNAPSRFLAPRLDCCLSMHHGSYCSPGMQLCSRHRFCCIPVNRFCVCHNSIEMNLRNVARADHSDNSANAAGQPYKTGEDGASFSAGDKSSNTGRVERQGSGGAEPSTHCYAQMPLCLPFVRYCCCCCSCCEASQCVTPVYVAATGQMPHQQQQVRHLQGYVAEQRQLAHSTQREQQHHHIDGGQQNNACIIEPQGRMLLECKTGEKVLIRRMQVSDYPAVRALLPHVSRCLSVLNDQQVRDVLSSSVFYAWCCYTTELKQSPPRSKEENQQQDARGQRFAEGEQQSKQHIPLHQQLRQQQQHAQQPREEQLQQDAEDSTLHTVHEEKKLVAYCELVLQPRLGRRTDGRLERVVVDEEFRGRGVASLMCAAILAAAKEKRMCGFVDLTVEKDEARHIYEDKLGFRKVDTTVLRLEL